MSRNATSRLPEALELNLFRKYHLPQAYNNIMQIETSIKDYIAEHFLFSEEGFPYTDDTSFLQEGIIDSLGVMELVAFVQTTYQVAIDPTEVTPDHFDSIAKLAAFVRLKTQKQ